jgi:hypothetical protein
MVDTKIWFDCRNSKKSINQMTYYSADVVFVNFGIIKLWFCKSKRYKTIVRKKRVTSSVLKNSKTIVLTKLWF